VAGGAGRRGPAPVRHPHRLPLRLYHPLFRRLLEAARDAGTRTATSPPARCGYRAPSTSSSASARSSSGTPRRRTRRLRPATACTWPRAPARRSRRDRSSAVSMHDDRERRSARAGEEYARRPETIRIQVYVCTHIGREYVISLGYS
jgi:hypothetical protein